MVGAVILGLVIGFGGFWLLLRLGPAFAAFILTIVAAVLCILCLVLGIVGVRNRQRRGAAVAMIVAGALGLLIIGFICVVVGIIIPAENAGLLR